jgi:DNA-binding XRE family transcriptional regulator
MAAPPKVHHAALLMTAVEAARATVSSLPDAPAPFRPKPTGAGAKEAKRKIHFPKTTSALRQHVAEVQQQTPRPTASRLVATPVTAPAPLSPPGPSPALRARVAEARRRATAPQADPGVPSGTTTAQDASDLSLDRPEAIGGLIRTTRVRRKMSQTALAQAAGTGRRFISELEAGKSTAALGLVLAVCRALQLRLMVEPADG